MIISEIDGVLDCAMMKIPQEEGKENYSFEEIVSCITLEDDGCNIEDIVREIFTTPRLDDHQQVQEVMIMKEIPHNGSDKVDQTKLLEYYVKNCGNENWYRSEDFLAKTKIK